jgi:anaerobic selenocysteine-containing dehydrogenase
VAAGNIVGGKTMETKKQDVGQTGRRDFLKLSALGAAAGTVIASGSATADEEKPVSGSGYRETDHVKTFYETARF